MPSFLKGNRLNTEIENLIEKAEDQLIIISPFIRLHDRLKFVLKSKLKNDKLRMIIVFGKNEKHKSKSLSMDDFQFFSKFPNIEIHYQKRLHAKFYASENRAILTSMNLHSFSQNNNIEFGILTKGTKIGGVVVGDRLGQDSFSYFFKVIDQSKLIFKKEPQYERTKLGLTCKYKESIVKVDELTENLKPSQSNYYKKKAKDDSKENKSDKTGYCIRTGTQIPYDLKKPMCYQAYKEWNRYSNSDYPEKYCHFSGEPSHGKTSFNKPVLKKYWNVAKKLQQ